MSKIKQVNEDIRRIISVHGHEIRLNSVKTVDNTGSWLRLESEEGYVLVNPSNVLAMIIKGDKVF
jgi:hypothetical protein